MDDLGPLLARHLTNWRTGWSMGTFGAIAEFHHDEGEPAVVDEAGALTRATARGAVRIDRLAGIRAVAYETVSPKRHRWSQAVALCLPEAEARRSARSVLTELGPDQHAIRGQDRAAILFDMGLSLPQCDFCVRTDDPRLLESLCAHAGRSLFEHDNPVMMSILAGHPHRVALTNLGRVEVFQKIGGPDTGGVSPPGPHTHLLPKLLRAGRTHSANTPIPDGLLPLGSMHPGNPVIGAQGEDQPFDLRLFDDFQAMLDNFGDPQLLAAKKTVVAGLAAGDPPESFVMPASRFARAAARLALRQQARLADHLRDDRLSRAISAWQRLHDQGSETESEDDDAPGH
ncbi:hypothetical protein [Mesorhizobium sp. 65-26]|uniref:DUF6925 family protein n=2 Tax=unclassified Mesorhizobium TaxID=325217 RepID=UPI0009590F21|nr:hypothetical protein [Mesorhizobium sp. 65-26]MBN9254769.1 hypothetical protein [Mesorhizobium sp.]OJX72083.1 MAG: hypothetical protein BGO93_15745 [Mesorhizobium sp. 65-26]